MERWCRARGLRPNPLVRLDQLWHLAVHWYRDRLSEESRRPRADEIPRIFAEAGLTDPFWDLDQPR